MPSPFHGRSRYNEKRKPPKQPKPYGTCGTRNDDANCPAGKLCDTCKPPRKTTKGSA